VPTAVQAALLGVVQGLTEFLPVSSSAHLILARAFFGWDAERFGLPFDVAIHVGTALAVIVYFWNDLLRILSAVPSAVRPPIAASVPRGAASEGEREAARLVWLIVVGTLPAVLAGLAFDRLIEERLRTPGVSAVTLTLGALGFLVAERTGEQRRGEGTLSLIEAWWIGCAQALALVPGVSRSGATITAAMLLGVRRADAARFIFLLGLPAILGAAVKELPALAAGGLTSDLALVPVGVASAAVVGYLAIRFFIRYLGRHSLDAFAWYRLGLAASVVVWLAVDG
jgi:undecaprenyl-diphosphatase